MTNKLSDTSKLTEIFNNYFEKFGYMDEMPTSLYDPIKYYLSFGAKRIRPIFCIHSFQLYNSNFEESIPLASALELLHNFTLLHDDLMDDAPMRRGKPTIHTRWDANTAILSGDTLLILAFKELTRSNFSNNKEIIQSFIKAAEDVHKGQRLDIDFATKADVSYIEYINMIELKISCILGACMKIGSLAGGASIEESNIMYDLGCSMGIAFQLLDDLLDCFGDEKRFGKQIGGDIICGNKTSLHLKFLELVDEKTKELYLKSFLDYGLNNKQKIEIIKDFYIRFNIKEVIENEIRTYRSKYTASFNILNIPEFKKKFFRELLDIMFMNSGITNEYSNNNDFDVNDLLLLYNNIFIIENKLDPIEKSISFLNELQHIPKIDLPKIFDMRDKLEYKKNKTAKVFISYSHCDEHYKNRLDKALYALKRNNRITVWEDRLLVAGQAWEQELFEKLEEAEVILMILSDDYIASDFCYSREFKYVLDSHKRKSKVLIPIIVRPCSWQDLEFGAIQAVPKDGTPINTYTNEDLAWHEVVQAIKRSIDYFAVQNL